MKQKNDHLTFLSWLERQSSIKEETGRFSTARNYRNALKSFSEFSGSCSHLPRWPDEATILKYNTWLQRRGIVRNTISFYMRILRSVYNKAADSGLVRQRHPFLHVYTGIDKTRKRALDEKLILRLQSLELIDKPSLELARDMFIFSYCTRGMSFVDMAFLKKRNILGETISYNRKKTGQRIDVRIEKCTRQIIDRYRNPESEFIFPVINDSSPETAYRQYQSHLSYYNRNLKRLGSLAGTDIRLSSYMARHSWASNARKHNIPLSIISAGMGHDSERTTLIYLTSLDSSVVDKANKMIVGILNGDDVHDNDNY